MSIKTCKKCFVAMIWCRTVSPIILSACSVYVFNDGLFDTRSCHLSRKSKPKDQCPSCNRPGYECQHACLRPPRRKFHITEELTIPRRKAINIFLQKSLNYYISGYAYGKNDLSLFCFFYVQPNKSIYNAIVISSIIRCKKQKIEIKAYIKSLYD